MGSGRDKRKKVKEKQKIKEAAAERVEKQRERERAVAGGDGVAAAEPEVVLTIEEKRKKNKLSGMKELTEMINDIRKSDKLRKVVSVQECPPPSARLNSSLTLINGSEALLFGGEFYDGNPVSTFVYNDLFRWNIDKRIWHQIYSINTPPPRCSHQSVVFRDQYFMFGGEFCTSDKFHHHRDFWCLNLHTNIWDEIKARGGPSARSGHRMVVWRNFIILFGGFYEAFKETQWFNDLYVFSISTMAWKKIIFAPTAPLPSPRSGHQLIVYNDQLILSGGYAKVKRSKKTEAKVHRDMWTLDLGPLLEHTKNDYPAEWIRVPRRGHAPSDRAGAVMVNFRKMAVQFGGVFDGSSLNTAPTGFDNKAKAVAVKAVFFNDMHSYDLEARRWHEMPLLRKDVEGKSRRKAKDGGEDELKEQEGSGDEELQMYHREWDGNGAIYGSARTTKTKPNEEEEQEFDRLELEEHPVPLWMRDDEVEAGWPPYRKLLESSLRFEQEEIKREETDKLQSFENEMGNVSPSSLSCKHKEKKPGMPIGRLNPSVLLKGHSLIIYGGSFEHKKREWALDDCWSIDLLSRDKWQCLLEGTPRDMENEVTSEEEDDESDDEDDDDDDEEEEYDDEEGGELGAENAEGKPLKVKLSEVERLRMEVDRDDPLTPNEKDTLRDYFTRSAGQWATIAVEKYRPNTYTNEEELRVLRLSELEKHENIQAPGREKSTSNSKPSSKKKSAKSKQALRDPTGMVSSSRS